MLELAILGLLKERPVHGYELKKQLHEVFGDLWGVSFGSLYPALKRLERAGAITMEDDSTPGRPGAPGPSDTATPIPPTGSISGDRAAALSARLRRATSTRRTRKAYRITERGQVLFDELLAADATPGSDEDRAFALRLAFCRHLPSEARLNLLQRRRAYLADKLARARRVLAATTHRDTAGSSIGPADLYTRSLIEHGTETTERDLRWVEQLIDTERRGGVNS